MSIYDISLVILSCCLLSFGFVACAVKYTKYQVEDLNKKLELKEQLSEEEKLLLEITKEYLVKVK
jgi:hypothetical protein